MQDITCGLLHQRANWRRCWTAPPPTDVSPFQERLVAQIVLQEGEFRIDPRPAWRHLVLTQANLKQPDGLVEVARDCLPAGAAVLVIARRQLAPGTKVLLGLDFTAEHTQEAPQRTACLVIGRLAGDGHLEFGDGLLDASKTLVDKAQYPMM